MSVNEETLLDESFILDFSSLIIKYKKSFRRYTFTLSTKELLLFLSETLNMMRITFNSEGNIILLVIFTGLESKVKSKIFPLQNLNDIVSPFFNFICLISKLKDKSNFPLKKLLLRYKGFFPFLTNGIPTDVLKPDICFQSIITSLVNESLVLSNLYGYNISISLSTIIARFSSGKWVKTVSGFNTRQKPL